jgi:hypothetical protein
MVKKARGGLFSEEVKKKNSPETAICSIDEPVVSAGAPKTKSSRNLIRGGS